MISCESSKALVHLVSLALLAFLVFKVTSLLLKYQENMVGTSVSYVHDHYVKFPSISICSDLDSKKDNLGFKENRPLSKIFKKLEFVWHFNNG